MNSAFDNLQELAKIFVLTPNETINLITSCGCNERTKTGNTKKVSGITVWLLNTGSTTVNHHNVLYET